MNKIRYLKKPQKVVAKRRNDQKQLRLIFIGISLILITLLLYLAPRAKPTQSIISYEAQTRLNQQVRTALVREMGLKGIQIKSDVKDQLALAFNLPDRFNKLELQQKIKERLAENGFSVRKTINLSRNRGFTFYVDYQTHAVGSLSFIKGGDFSDFAIYQGQLKQKPQLSIVIDDFGYSNNDVIQGFLELPIDLTVSVIPGHRFSRWCAAKADELGKEVIVHMPMEPEDRNYAAGEDQYMLMNNLMPFQIEQRIRSAFMELPQAVGLNNHMGSLVTTNERIMGVVATTLKKNGKYFIDSLTTPRSVAYEVAKSAGVPATVRTVFLDNQRNKDEIRAHFEKALQVAQRSGYALVIGHVYKETLETLREMIADQAFKDISLAFASEVVS